MDGTQIDAVTFTNQLDNVSMGRSPDGSANIVLLPTPSARGSNGGMHPSQIPQITRVTFTGDDVVQLTVSTVAGRSYQVEFKDDLSASRWLPLGDQRLAGWSESHCHRHSALRPTAFLSRCPAAMNPQSRRFR